jgi:hypothetical protein
VTFCKPAAFQTEPRTLGSGFRDAHGSPDLLDVARVVPWHVTRQVRHGDAAAFGVHTPALPLFRGEPGQQTQVGLTQQAEHLEGFVRVPGCVIAAPRPFLLIEARQRNARVLEHLAVAPTAAQFVLGKMGQNCHDTPLAGRGWLAERRFRGASDELGQRGRRFALFG